MTSRCTLLYAIVLAAATSVTPPGAEIYRSLDAPDFIDLQRLSDREVRSRFSLPPWCDPSLSAVRGGRGRFHVTITCSRRIATDDLQQRAIGDDGRR